jgi:hypothetical protein
MLPSTARHDETHETAPQTLIDHTYRDFSTIEPDFDGPEQSIHGHSKKTSTLVSFPMKLHRMISDPKNAHIIGWMPHGRSWMLRDKSRLEELCKEYFRHGSFSSFNRSVNGWGFKVRPYVILCDHVMT